MTLAGSDGLWYGCLVVVRLFHTAPPLLIIVESIEKSDYVPASINEFQEMHIPIVWDELRLRFGFDLKAWKSEFSTFLTSQPRNTTEADAFIQFGNRRINPVLNSILRRNELYPTFNNLILYIVGRKRNTKK